jgi:hypothetical protein
MNPRGDAPIRACGDKEFVGRTRKQKVLHKFEIIEKLLRKIQQIKANQAKVPARGGTAVEELFERYLPGQRNIRGWWFVYTSAAGIEAALGESELLEIRNPAVAAAGPRHASLSGR